METDDKYRETATHHSKVVHVGLTGQLGVSEPPSAFALRAVGGNGLEVGHCRRLRDGLHPVQVWVGEADSADEVVHGVEEHG